MYVNTPMIQRALAEPDWSSRMTPEDLSAPTPLIFHHMNPQGTFELDMGERIPIGAEVA